MNFYIKKEWVDQEPGIEMVLIHYATCYPWETVDWEKGRNTRVLVPEEGGVRRKVLKLPRGLDAQNGHYHFAYYFEVLKEGERYRSDTFIEDIVCKEIDFLDGDGRITNVCVYWSIYDWDAPNYSPMDDPRFPDGEFTADCWYHSPDKDYYVQRKREILAQIPNPKRWVSLIWGPRGATVWQQFHVGRLGSPDPGDNFEMWYDNDGRFWQHVL